MIQPMSAQGTSWFLRSPVRSESPRAGLMRKGLMSSWKSGGKFEFRMQIHSSAKFKSLMREYTDLNFQMGFVYSRVRLKIHERKNTELNTANQSFYFPFARPQLFGIFYASCIFTLTLVLTGDIFCSVLHYPLKNEHSYTHRTHGFHKFGFSYCVVQNIAVYERVAWRFSFTFFIYPT